METKDSENLNPGTYSIPVKVQGGTVNDPSLSGYETPSFIHKKETVSKPEDPVNDIKDIMEKDIQQFISQFDNAKDKKDRIEICILC
jgi:formylmethanofuran dehydrogenase subunit D